MNEDNNNRKAWELIITTIVVLVCIGVSFAIVFTGTETESATKVLELCESCTVLGIGAIVGRSTSR